MPNWLIRLIGILAAFAISLFLIRIVARLSARAYQSLTREVDSVIATISGGGSSAVEQVVSLGLTLVVVILLVKFLLRRRT